MGIVGWIVLAFILGVIFGRLTARSSSGRTASPLEPGRGAGSGTGVAPSAPASAFSSQQVSVTVEPPVVSNVPWMDALTAGMNGSYRVTLADSGPNKINTIKAIREVTHLGLKEAKDLADSAPCQLMQTSSRQEAEAVLRKFAGVASVRMEGGSSEPLPPDLQAALARYGEAVAKHIRPVG